LEKAGFWLFSDMDYETYAPYEKKVECSDLTYVIMDCYNTYPYYVKIVQDCLVIAAYVDEEADFNATTPREMSVDWVYVVIIPLEDDKLIAAFYEVAELFQKLGIPMKLGTISEQYKKILERIPLLKNSFHYHEERSDYVYLRDEYIDISGGKNAKKRRDLNKIAVDYPEASVVPITDWKASKPVIMEIIDEWCKGYDCEKCAYGCERKVIDYLLDTDLTDRLTGAIMYLGDEPEMFAISQIIGDTCFLFFKKSVNRIHGAFYYFEYEFMKMLEGVTYVNFQEDLGLPGLREYKRRRHPVKMIDKYETNVFYWNSGYATGDDQEELIALWQEAFGDSRQYILQFLERFFKENNVYVWRENHKIVSAAYVLPAKMCYRKDGEPETVEAYYLYAVATKKEYRGKKLFQKLLSNIKNDLGADAVLFLVPEDGVIPYYRQLGLELYNVANPWQEGKEENGENRSIGGNTEEKAIELSEVKTAIEYYELRERTLNKNLEDTGAGFVSWNAEHIDWALENIKMLNGLIYRIAYETEEFLLAGFAEEKDGSRVFHVMETTLGRKEFEKIGAYILKEINCSSFYQKPLQFMSQKEWDTPIYLAFPLG